MTRVDFHSNVPGKLAYACRLVRKAYGAGQKVIVVGDRAALEAFDAQISTGAGDTRALASLAKAKASEAEAVSSGLRTNSQHATNTAVLLQTMVALMVVAVVLDRNVKDMEL